MSRSRLVLLLVPLAILAMALAGGHVLVLRLFVLSVLVLLLGFLWVRLGTRKIEGHVRLSAERCQVGGWLDHETTVSNQGILPSLLVKVTESTDMPGYDGTRLVNLAPRSTQRWEQKLECQARGRYRFGELSGEVVDPFGLFRARRKLYEGRNVLVYPATVELPYFWLSSQVEAGGGQSRWLTIEPSAAVSGVREYSPGDSLSRVHWPGTAHAGKLVVKSFDLDLAKNIWVVLDMGEVIPPSPAEHDVEELSVTIAASLVKQFLEGGRRVGLLSQGSDLHLFAPQSGHNHLWDMMEALAVVRRVGVVPLDRLLAGERERLRGNTIAVVITGSATEPAVESMMRLGRAGVAVVGVLVDSASFGGQLSASHAADRLNASGVPAYIVRKGDNLARVLDSRGRLAVVGR